MELLALHGFGPKVLRILTLVMEELGVSLRDNSYRIQGCRDKTGHGQSLARDPSRPALGGFARITAIAATAGSTSSAAIAAL